MMTLSHELQAHLRRAKLGTPDQVLVLSQHLGAELANLENQAKVLCDLHETAGTVDRILIDDAIHEARIRVASIKRTVMLLTLNTLTS